jgi:two-component system catabolic regulation response regulator CreB/two-component system response regulator ChvI
LDIKNVENPNASNERLPPRYRILAVDDEPDVAMTWKVGLEEYEGGAFIVDIFNDSKEALSSFKPGIYDLLLLDIKMPKMNGFELYDNMRKIDDKAKACFITAFEVYYKSLKELFPSIEVECFITKPISVKDLANKIKQELLENKKNQRHNNYE